MEMEIEPQHAAIIHNTHYQEVGDDIGGPGEDLGETESITNPELYKEGWILKPKPKKGVVIFLGADGFGLALPTSPKRVLRIAQRLPRDFFISPDEWNKLAVLLAKLVSRRVLWMLFGVFVILPIVVFFGSLLLMSIFLGAGMKKHFWFYVWLVLLFASALTLAISPLLLLYLTKPWKDAMWRGVDKFLLRNGALEQRLGVKMYHARLAYFPRNVTKCLFRRGPAHLFVVEPPSEADQLGGLDSPDPNTDRAMACGI
ncbi:hypothetical protein PAPYR_3663 [Paratrimastix pyriformis]|uniref:Uncharacterized protein n=1 Tax=Paratrimastix pyriformis TaxID=342808 RepID=A0ABQ8USD3_9EUKA|nr:hypothetical protein PAPYR_3663 [Paratrimastix pyriformis]